MKRTLYIFCVVAIMAISLITCVSADDKPLDVYAKGYDGGEEITVNIIGDSISYDTATNTGSNKYHGVWASDFKMQINNYSRGGTNIKGTGAYDLTEWEGFAPRLERMINGDVREHDAVSNKEKPDLIVVFGGVNDYNTNTAIGTVNDTTKEQSYMGAVSEIIRKAQKAYPDAKLVFFTPLKSDSSILFGQDINMRPAELEAYADAIVEVCKKYDVAYVDLYHNEKLDFTGALSKYLSDGIHPTTAGHRLLAAVAIEEMEKQGVIKTHGYTTPAAQIKELSATRSNSTYARVYTASQLGRRTKYDSATVIDRYIFAKHETTEDALRFTSKIFMSELAPSISVNLSAFNFEAVDYPYMTLVYRTSSEKEKIDISLRGNNNSLSKLDASKTPALVKDEKAAFTVNLNDFANESLVIENNKTYTDLYYTINFFDSTVQMGYDGYVDIIAIGFFDNEAAAKSYDGEYYKGSGFTDTLSHWACDNIDYVVRAGLFSGVSTLEFKPNNKMTRAMLAVVLSRLGNDTENTTAYPYKDVAADAWFAKGVSFVYSKGICEPAETFRPDDNITREEIADMLYRYAKVSGKTLGKAELDFADADKIDEDKREAFEYCVYAGIFKGNNDNTVNPDGEASRAEVSALLQRFVNAQ